MLSIPNLPIFTNPSKTTTVRILEYVVGFSYYLTRWFNILLYLLLTIYFNPLPSHLSKPLPNRTNDSTKLLSIQPISRRRPTKTTTTPDKGNMKTKITRVYRVRKRKEKSKIPHSQNKWRIIRKIENPKHSTPTTKNSFHSAQSQERTSAHEAQYSKNPAIPVERKVDTTHVSTLFNSWQVWFSSFDC